MKKTFAIMLAAALLLTTLCCMTGCGKQEATPAQDAAQTQEAAPAQEAAPEEKAASIVGVWKNDTYLPGSTFVYTFRVDGTGQYDAAGTIMPFKYTVDGSKLSILYDGNTESFDTEFVLNGNELNVKDSNGKDTIYQRDLTAEESVEPTYLFDKGVWSASIDGKIDTYFIFADQTSGRTERADGTGGTPFTCEQKGTEATFHFGSADDVTKATFSLGENTGTFQYGDKTVTYFFEHVGGADADNFKVPAAQ